MSGLAQGICVYAYVCLTASVLAASRTCFPLSFFYLKVSLAGLKYFWEERRVYEQGCLLWGIWKTLLRAERGPAAGVSRQPCEQRADSGIWLPAGWAGSVQTPSMGRPDRELVISGGFQRSDYLGNFGTTSNLGTPEVPFLS